MSSFYPESTPRPTPHPRPRSTSTTQPGHLSRSSTSPSSSPPPPYSYHNLPPIFDYKSQYKQDYQYLPPSYEVHSITSDGYSEQLILLPTSSPRTTSFPSPSYYPSDAKIFPTRSTSNRDTSPYSRLTKQALAAHSRNSNPARREFDQSRRSDYSPSRSRRGDAFETHNISVGAHGKALGIYSSPNPHFDAYGEFSSPSYHHQHGSYSHQNSGNVDRTFSTSHGSNVQDRNQRYIDEWNKDARPSSEDVYRDLQSARAALGGNMRRSSEAAKRASDNHGSRKDRSRDRRGRSQHSDDEKRGRSHSKKASRNDKPKQGRGRSNSDSESESVASRRSDRSKSREKSRKGGKKGKGKRESMEKSSSRGRKGKES